MLRIVQIGGAIPMSYICDPSASFEPGQVAQLVVVGNTVMATVSNGTAPLGIIDDVKTKAFTNISWNEVIIVPATGVAGPNNTLVTPIDLKAELRRPNVVKSSFSSTVDVVLNPINGVITFVAGTPLNFDMTGGGTPNAIRTVVNYSYAIANIPGDDSTLGNGRVTLWTFRMFCQVSTYEANQTYPLNANLYVSENGFFTTRRPSPAHPAVALVTDPPSSINSLLGLIWL